MSREDALELGIPVFVGRWYGAGDTPSSISVSTISSEDSEEVAGLFGAPTGATK
jgi:hypothetical protein